jgi:hypothetical protein
MHVLPGNSPRAGICTIFSAKTHTHLCIMYESVFACTNIYIYVYVYVYVYMCVCLYIYVYIYIYTYTYIHGYQVRPPLEANWDDEVITPTGKVIERFKAIKADDERRTRYVADYDHYRYVCTYVCVFVCVYVYTRMHVCMHILVCLFIFKCKTYVWMHEHVCMTCVYLHVCVHTPRKKYGCLYDVCVFTYMYAQRGRDMRNST